MKFSKYLAIPLLILPILFVGNFAFAREPWEITDWYIKDFNSIIAVNQDSSLLITENIVADAGTLPDKHGIFRTLPTEISTEKGVFKTPIELISITDAKGNPYNYQTIHNRTANTITWKIGDPNKTVQGENTYQITYKVKNAIRFGSDSFDELYWNLLGNFWDLYIDHVFVKILLPAGAVRQNTQISYYTGLLGSNSHELANYQWTDSSTLEFLSTQPLSAGEGITASLTFPKNIFTPYQSSFIEQYGSYLFFLVPLLLLILAYTLWLKYGKDPKMKSPIPPEFGIPEKLSPMQIGIVLKHGAWDNKFIVASMIDLAVRKYIKIEEVETKVLFIKIADYKLTKAQNYNNLDALTEAERILLTSLFGNSDTVNISELKTSFPQSALLIKKAAMTDVIEKGWIIKSGNVLKVVFIILAGVCAWASIFFGLAALANTALFLVLLLSATILLVFGLLMPKRTQKGVDLMFKIKGFKLYMKQAENYRQQFYEKENIFDKFLPYAMVFGITKLWIQKMETIYGKDFYANYHPAWYGGAALGTFNVDTFNSHINTMVAGISGSTGTSSGSGGGGFSGGGGGGGGGGGW